MGVTISELRGYLEDPTSREVTPEEFEELSSRIEALADIEFPTPAQEREFLEASGALLLASLANPLLGVGTAVSLISRGLFQLAGPGASAGDLVAVTDSKLLPQRWDRSQHPPKPVYWSDLPETWTAAPEQLTPSQITALVREAVTDGLGPAPKAARVAAHFAAGIAGAGEFASSKGLFGQTRIPTSPVALGGIWNRALQGGLPLGVSKVRFLAYLHAMLSTSASWAPQTFGFVVEGAAQPARNGREGIPGRRSLLDMLPSSVAGTKGSFLDSLASTPPNPTSSTPDVESSSVPAPVLLGLVGAALWFLL